MNAHSRIALMIAGLAIAVPQGPALAKGLNAKMWTGTFQLNLDKSKFTSPDYTPKSDTRTYRATGNRLTMQSKGVNAAGKAMTWGYSATLDGKWAKVTGNPNTDRVALTLVSDREFKSTSKLKGKTTAKSTLTASEDGKAITIHRSILNAKGGPTDDTLVFDRTK